MRNAVERDGEMGVGRGRGKSNELGPLVLLAAAGVGLIGVGGYPMVVGWSNLGALRLISLVLFIVLGAVLVSPLLLILASRGFLWYFNRRFSRELGELGGAVGKMIDLNAKIYGSSHEYRAARHDDYAGVDRGWYDSVQQALEGEGFRFLGDLVDETIEKINGLCIPIRAMVSSEGEMQAGIYHFSMPGMGNSGEGSGGRGGWSSLRICDVETELEDGRFVVTSNTLGFDQMTPPPEVLRAQFPSTTGPVELLLAHRARVEKLVGEGGGKVVVVMTLEECVASQNRLQAVKSGFRKKIGYLDPEEVGRTAGKTLGAGAVWKLAAEQEMERRRSKGK